jgi:hypothetical protein
MVVCVFFRATSPPLSLNTKPEPCDSLVRALAIVTSSPKPEQKSVSLASVVPSFRFDDKSKNALLHRLITDQTLELQRTFQTSAEAPSVCVPLVDVFTCLYRFRYLTSASLPLDEAVRNLGADLRRHLLISWSYAIIHCAQPIESPTAKVYFSRLALHCSRTVERAAKALGLPCEDLVRACQTYADEEVFDGIEGLALDIAHKAQQGIDDGLAATPACEIASLRLLLNLAVIVLAAVIAGMYPVDLETIGGKICDYTKAVVTRSNVDQVGFY